MTTPRVEVDLGKLRQNTRCLVERLRPRGISVTAVTKAVCGNPMIAQAMLDGGAADLADARVSNVIRLSNAGLTCPISLIRTPMLSQADEIVRYCDVSYNSDIGVIEHLAAAALRIGSPHKVVLMVEMGDLREGVLSQDLAAAADQVVKMAGVDLIGIAANFACLSGISPDVITMQEFSDLASEVEAVCGPFIKTVSGGNSANLPWAMGPSSTGRVNNLRLGEAILLGRDPVSGEQIGGLHTNAFALVAEVIETKIKPDHPLTSLFGPALNGLRIVPNSPLLARSVLAIGQQDTDIIGLRFPVGMTTLGATSDHMVVQDALRSLRVGSEVRFQLSYSALMRIMAAPDTHIVMVGDAKPPKRGPAKRSGPVLELV